MQRIATSLLVFLTGCAAGYGRPAAPAGALWVDATRTLHPAKGLPALYVRADDEPPPPDPSPSFGALAGVRGGYGASRFGDLPFVAGPTLEPEVELALCRPPFCVALHGGYLMQGLSSASSPKAAYAAPSVTLTVGYAVTPWLALHAGGGVLVDGQMHVRNERPPECFPNPNVACPPEVRTANAWGGRALAGIDLALLRGRLVGLDARLDFEFTQTGEGVMLGKTASMQHFGGLASVAWSFSPQRKP